MKRKHYRRHRRLRPDSALHRRRAAGETLRELADDYDVEHTTLSRYFRRPQVSKEVERLEQLNRADQRANEAKRRAEDKAERDARRQATRELNKGPAQSFDESEELGLVATALDSRPDQTRIVRPPHEYDYCDWLDDRDAAVVAPAEGVCLVTETGEEVGTTGADNAERMREALGTRYGPLTIVSV